MDYLDDYSDSDTEGVEVFTPDDYLNNIHTSRILEEEHFEKFKVQMADIIEEFYNNKVYESTIDYMDIFDKDFHKKKSYDFFLTIYPFIVKSYDFSIFDKQPYLQDYLIKKKGKEKIVEAPKEKVIIQSKKYDWNAKKYK